MLRGVQDMAIGGPLAAISACLAQNNTARSMIRRIDEAGRLRVSDLPAMLRIALQAG